MKIDLETIKQANPIEAVITETAKVTLAGRRAYLKATEHSSLVVDVDKQAYWWNSKGHQGDVISWLENVHGYTFKQAVEWLAARAGMDLDWGAGSDDWQRTRKRQDALGAVMAYFIKCAATSAAYDDYRASRGWALDTGAEAGLGWYDGDRHSLLRAMKIEGLAADHDVVKAAGSIPAMSLVYGHSLASRVRYFSTRATKPGAVPKMWNPPAILLGDRRPYFNHKYQSRAKNVVIVEGQADAITLAQWGVAAVALAGCSLDLVLAKQLAGHGQIYLGLDDDQAGRAGTGAAAALLGAGVRVVTWPQKDPNDWLVNDRPGRSKVIELLQDAPLYVMWLAGQVATAQGGTARVGAVRATVAEAVRLDVISWRMNRSDIAGAMGIGLTDLDAMVKEQRQVSASQPANKPASKPVSSSDDGTHEAMIKAALLKEEASHHGHARCLALLYPNKFLYVNEWGWLRFNGTHWQRGADLGVEAAVTDTLKQRAHAAIDQRDSYGELLKRTSTNRGWITGTRDQLRVIAQAEYTDFDQQAWLLNCANGVVDLRTGQLMAHDSSTQHFTYCLPTNYDPDADYSQWLIFLCGVIGQDGLSVDSQVIKYLQQAVGYSLTGETREEIFFYLYGPTRSGKGTFTETLLALLGDPLGKEVDFATLTADRSGDTDNFDLAHLFASRFITAAESGKYKRINEAKIKAMTGGNQVRCSFKRKDHFEYWPRFKIWMTSNWPLNLDVDDHAAWGRANVINFPHSHLGREDKGLKRRLREPAQLEGVLAWAVAGAIAWYASEDGLVAPKAIKAATAQQRLEQDLIRQWIDDCMAVADPECRDDDCFMTSGDLYAAFQAWAASQGIAPNQIKKVRWFGISLASKGYSPARTTRAGKQVRGYWGLRLRPDAPGVPALAQKGMVL